MHSIINRGTVITMVTVQCIGVSNRDGISVCQLLPNYIPQIIANGLSSCMLFVLLSQAIYIYYFQFLIFNSMKNDDDAMLAKLSLFSWSIEIEPLIIQH